MAQPNSVSTDLTKDEARVLGAFRRVVSLNHSALHIAVKDGTLVHMKIEESIDLADSWKVKRTEA